MSARRMLPEELEVAISVWRAANIARGAPHGAERTDRIRAKLSAPDALAFVALRSEIVGMVLAEPGRLDDGEGELDPTLLHISMVFVHPAAQGTGVGSSLVLHVLDVARSLGYQRANVWTYSDNTPARRLYDVVGMAATGNSKARAHPHANPIRMRPRRPESSASNKTGWFEWLRHSDECAHLRSDRPSVTPTFGDPIHD